MKIKKVTLLLLMGLICPGCSPRNDETPVCSSSLKSEAIESSNSVGVETGMAAGSIERASKMEGNFIKYRTINEEESAVKAPESAEQSNMDLCSGFAEEIVTNFSHIRTDGTKCYVLSPLIYGENIARGPHATGAEFLEHWMDSEGHKENILNPQYTTIGIGTTCTEQGDTAVQLFGID